MSILKAADYLVVGGGTAGVVAAVRLAERLPDAQVILLEAGPSDKGVDVIQTLPRWAELLGGPFDYDYTIEPQARGNSKMRHSRGKMLGGCSSHNSCIAFVPPEVDFELWLQAGAAGWGPKDVAPAYTAVRNTVSFESADTNNELVQAFLQACDEAGLPTVDFATPFKQGAGWFQLNKKGLTRASSSNAYLHDRQPPKNLEVVTGARAERLVFQAGRATGVLTDAGRFEANSEVIVCCGAFDTPKLLMLSGVGPAEHLRSLGITVQLDQPRLGENLIDHPEGVLIFESKRPIPPEAVQRYEAGAFVQVDSEAPWPDLMFHFGVESFDMNTKPAGYPVAEHAFSFTPNVTRAQSQGTVRLRSADSADAPKIDFAYFTDPDGYDERIMLAGADWAREIASRPAMSAWVARELAPGADTTDRQALSDYMRRTGNTVYHPAGTCALNSVVDSSLKVRGLEGLRIADASVFPQMVSVNPAITVMMLGERLAQFCAEEA